MKRFFYFIVLFLAIPVISASFWVFVGFVNKISVIKAFLNWISEVTIPGITMIVQVGAYSLLIFGVWKLYKFLVKK